MSEINLYEFSKKHKKNDINSKLKKQNQKEKNRIAGIERHKKFYAHKKNYYKNFAWWADFSGDQYFYNNGSKTLSGLYGQYTISNDGKTGKNKNEY